MTPPRAMVTKGLRALIVIGLGLALVAGAGSVLVSGLGSGPSSPQDPPYSTPENSAPRLPERSGITQPPPGAGPQRYGQQQVTWGRCPDGEPHHECAEVLAPLDWTGPDHQALTLFLRRVPASEQPRLGTLFVNPGGPGEPGSGLAATFARQGLERYDILGWDPRGTGRSTPVVCGSNEELDAYVEVDTSPDNEAERQALIAADRAFGQSCLVESGELLQHISTVDTVADLELLRQLVGEAQLNYFGYSYGTDIGSRYAHTYPDRVGRMVLDGAVNVTGSSVTQAVGFDRALTAFAHWCVEEGCRLGAEPQHVIETVTGLLDHVDEYPLLVGERRLTQAQALSGVLVALYGAEDSWRLLSEAITGVRSGDGALLLRMADRYNARHANGTYDSRFAAFAAIRCLDRGGPDLAEAERRAQARADQAPALGPYFGPDYVCATWPVPSQPSPEPVVAAGAPPILVIGATGDSATPYESATAMAAQLESGVLLTYDGPGHAIYGGRSACVDAAVVRYFTQPEPPIEQTCR